jgi:roadblock/LC7 domain-containing protein
VKHLAALATAVLLAISGVVAGGAQAAPFNPALPLSPASQQNALRSAKEYIAMGGYSHDGLIKQLEYEQFSEEDATYAADNVGADWNQQAAKSAKSYIAMSGYSHSGLVEQLEYEGFTSSQAEYGVAAAGL